MNKSKIEFITINKDDIICKDFVSDCRPCGLKKNEKFSLDDLPITIEKEKSFINFNEEVLNKHSTAFPDDIQKGIDKYIKMVENFKHTKNPKLSVEKAIQRELKKKKKKTNLCKIMKIKKTVEFK